MHATSGVTEGVATEAALLRDLNEGRGRGSIWMTLDGPPLKTSAALLFPSKATGTSGFHI